MSVKLTNISHSAPNWEKDVNNNFAQLHQDTGWIPFDFVAPSSGTLQYKILNDILFFMGTVKAGATNNVVVGTFPDTIGMKNFTVKDITANEPLPATITVDSNLVLKGNAVGNNISFDGVALYVGN